jgi:hypothetical protein
MLKEIKNTFKKATKWKKNQLLQVNNGPHIYLQHKD